MSAVDNSFVFYDFYSSYAVGEEFVQVDVPQLLTGTQILALKKYKDFHQPQKVYSPLQETLTNQSNSSNFSASLKKGKSVLSYAGGSSTVQTTGTASFYAMSAVTNSTAQSQEITNNYAIVLASPGGRPGSGTPAVGEVDMPIGGVAPLLVFAALYTAVRKFIHRKK